MSRLRALWHLSQVNPASTRREPVMHRPEPTHGHQPEDDTDLPLLPGGNNGNHAGARNVDSDEPWLLLDDAAQRLPDPPIDVLDAQAVLEWIERATERLALREDRRRLARDAMLIVDRDFQTAMNVGRLRQQLERQEADQCARHVGTYWADRDKHRRAQQPTHVEVDLDAWRSLRAASAQRGRSIGHEVGRLVVAEVAHPGSGTLAGHEEGRRGSAGGGRRATLFARLVVTKPTWQVFRGLAAVRDITVARYVGRLVEECVDAAG